MIIPIKQIILEATIRNFKHLDLGKNQNISKTNSMYDTLYKFLKIHKIPFKDVVVFGSAVLGIKGLRVPNDLDIAIKKEQILKLKRNKEFKPAKGSYGAQYDIGELSFIDDRAVPKIENKNIFSIGHTKHLDIPTITFDTWKKMQKNDPNKKDIKFLETK